MNIILLRVFQLGIDDIIEHRVSCLNIRINAIEVIEHNRQIVLCLLDLAVVKVCGDDHNMIFHIVL